MHSDEFFMERCIQLAKLGMGEVAPNPLVGALIVHKGEIIGEGYHEKYGFAHAEVNAINSIKDPSLLKESTIYVSLEPCVHYGKTPPCVLLLTKIKRVVIGSLDTFSKVNGKGIQILREKGVEVKVGVLEEACRALNKHFFTFNESHRPYILLKWAQSMDGFIDKDAKQYWVSAPETQTIVHKLRSEYQGVLVGRKTVQSDNPTLTVRAYRGKNPIRIVIDSELRLKQESLIFNDEAPTVILNTQKQNHTDNLSWIKLEKVTSSTIIDAIYKLGIQSIIIEGGRKTLQSFIDAKLWDEALVIQGEECLVSGTKAPTLNTQATEEIDFFGDQILTYYNV
ncbi:MAG: bifunctional diaminohydroxyphosphoribosylaminopyrimidine deaminase/5-amino-6-(5-phosphoribosylamino)uracil reductase RibD [Crocinitomicaceae bacterium]